MSEVRPAEKTARSDNTPVHQSCASGQLCGEDQESDRKHNQLLYQYFGMLYTEPDVHYTAGAKKLATCSWFYDRRSEEGPFVVICPPALDRMLEMGVVCQRNSSDMTITHFSFSLLARQTSRRDFPWPRDETR